MDTKAIYKYLSFLENNYDITTITGDSSCRTQLSNFFEPNDQTEKYLPKIEKFFKEDSTFQKAFDAFKNSLTNKEIKELSKIFNF